VGFLLVLEEIEGRLESLEGILKAAIGRLESLEGRLLSPFLFCFFLNVVCCKLVYYAVLNI
jgi:hypothetical protein